MALVGMSAATEGAGPATAPATAPVTAPAMTPATAPLTLCLVCLSPPTSPVGMRTALPGSGRPLCDVITELLTSRETRDRRMLSTVCIQCHRLLADFDQVSEQARGLRATIQSVFDGADRRLVAMLLEPRQSRAVLEAAARHNQTCEPQPQPTAQAVHIEILQAGPEAVYTERAGAAAVHAEQKGVENAAHPVPEKPTAPATVALPAGVFVPESATNGANLSPADDTSATATSPSDVADADVSTADMTANALSCADITVDEASPADVSRDADRGANAGISAPSSADATTAPDVPQQPAGTRPGRGGAAWSDVSQQPAGTRPGRGGAAWLDADPAGVGRYRCSVCGQAFPDKSHLLCHRRQVHASARRRTTAAAATAAHCCTVCAVTLPSRAALRRHVATHGQKVHSNQHVCAQCDKVFQHPGSLRAHAMLHDERCLRCPYCPQKYTSRQDLEQHVARHTGARNCACPDCGKTYRFRANLAHHIQTVHRREQLACPACGKTFNMRKKLNRHFNIVHGQLRYKCTKCEREFCYEGQLRRHMKKSKHVTTSGGSVAGVGKDRSLEAYIEAVETGEDGTQMLTLVIEDGAGGDVAGDDTAGGETLVLSVDENFNDDVSDSATDGAGLGADGAILEIIEEDDDAGGRNGGHIIFKG